MWRPTTYRFGKKFSMASIAIRHMSIHFIILEANDYHTTLRYVDSMLHCNILLLYMPSESQCWKCEGCSFDFSFAIKICNKTYEEGDKTRLLHLFLYIRRLDWVAFPLPLMTHIEDSIRLARTYMCIVQYTIILNT